MKFEHEPWVKLYRRVSAEWFALPLSARGLGRELLVYADDSGKISIRSRRTLADELKRLLGAFADESSRLRRDIKLLVDIGYVEVTENALIIRNYTKAQARSTSAERMRRLRARRHSDVTCDEEFASRDVTAFASHVTDTKRRDPPKPPKGGDGSSTLGPRPRGTPATSETRLTSAADSRPKLATKEVW